MLNAFLVEIYSDDRMCDDYRAYSSIEDPDELEELIGTSEEIMADAVDSHIGNWDDGVNIEEDEYEEWESMIAPHVKKLSNEEFNDEEYMEWFNNLPIIYEE